MKGALLALLLLGSLMGGCIGNEQEPAENTAAPAVPATAAVVHRALPASAPEAAGDPAQLLGADVPVPVGLQRLTGFVAFEPTLGITSTGTLFMALDADRSGTGSSVIRSNDRGETWTDATPRAGPIPMPPESSDPYLHVDGDTDRIFDVDQQTPAAGLVGTIGCTYLKWSDDEGETWTHNPVGCGQPPIVDHPTLFTGPPRQAQTSGYPNVVYLCSNQSFTLVADVCTTSTDGGATWAPVTTAFEACPEHSTGHGTTGPEGRAYLAKNGCGPPIVAISEDDGQSWTTHTISQDVPVRPDAHDVEVAVDAAGTVYALWMSEDDLPYLSFSTDHARTWSEPVMVGVPGIRTAVFPTISAGDAGKVTLAYYGTNSDMDQEDMDASVTWHAYLATLPNATAPEPVVATAPLNPPEDPVARGPCDDVNRCSDVGDFIDVVIDPGGRPWVAFVDVCHDACTAEDGTDRPEGAVGTLLQGFPLQGSGPTLSPLGDVVR